MERMGDILARTMSQRARQASAGDNAAPPPNATPARPAASRSRPTARPLADSRLGSRGRGLPTPASSASRRLTPRLLSPRAGNTGPLRSAPNRSSPASASPSSPTAQPTPAAPSDALETPFPSTTTTTRPGVARPRPADAAERVPAGERILELPPRTTANSAVRRPTGTLNASGDVRGDASHAAPMAASATPGPKSTRPLSPQVREDAADYATRGTPRAATGKTASAGSALCPICGGAGYVRLDVPLGDPAFGKPVACECKERQIEERRRSDLRRLSSLDAFLDKTFSTFDNAVQGTREAFEAARNFAADPEGWIVLSGTHGVGKTHLAAAIANVQLAQGTLVFFSIVPDLLDHLRAAFAPSSEVPYDEMFDKVREAGLLVLDDLGAENSTAWATEKLFQLINYRYNFRMPTVITTNTRLLSHMDERIRSRLSDIGLVRHVAIKAQDFRERHVERRQRTTGAPRPGGGTSGTRG